jgi:hypothetical protein
MIGRAVLRRFREGRHSLTRLVRAKSQKSADAIYWNPNTEEIHLDEWENFDGVIHLAGDNIFGRWSKKKKESIFLSRCRDTWLLSQVIARLERPPKFLFSASAVGFYGDRGDEVLTEESPRGTGFLSDVCVKWEEATKVASDRGIRVIHGRFGPVLSSLGGVFQKTAPIFRLGLGGRLGGGQQWMSWISLDDAVRGIEFVIEKSSLSGRFNFVSPQPVRNIEFTQALARALHRPACFPLPSFVLKILFGDLAKEVFLTSERVVPKNLTENGFQFSDPILDKALNQCLNKVQ